MRIVQVYASALAAALLMGSIGTTFAQATGGAAGGVGTSGAAGGAASPSGAPAGAASPSGAAAGAAVPSGAGVIKSPSGTTPGGTNATLGTGPLNDAAPPNGTLPNNSTNTVPMTPQQQKR